jgi:hypothetical protein
MSAELMRSYLDILNEQQQPQHLDEGIVDAIISRAKPWAQKNMASFLQKLDPQTLQGLKQAHQQSGGDIKRFASIIGITPQDIKPIAQKVGTNGGEDRSRPMQEAQNGWMLGSGTSLKSKILTGLFNWAPLLTFLDMFQSYFTGTNVVQTMTGPVMTYIWYMLMAVLFWGMGSYDFGDMDKAPKDRPRID